MCKNCYHSRYSAVTCINPLYGTKSYRIIPTQKKTNFVIQTFILTHHRSKYLHTCTLRLMYGWEIVLNNPIYTRSYITRPNPT